MRERVPLDWSASLFGIPRIGNSVFVLAHATVNVVLVAVAVHAHVLPPGVLAVALVSAAAAVAA